MRENANNRVLTKLWIVGWLWPQLEGYGILVGSLIVVDVEIDHYKNPFKPVGQDPTEYTFAEIQIRRRNTVVRVNKVLT